MEYPTFRVGEAFPAQPDIVALLRAVIASRQLLAMSRLVGETRPPVESEQDLHLLRAGFTA